MKRRALTYMGVYVLSAGVTYMSPFTQLLVLIGMFLYAMSLVSRLGEQIDEDSS